MQSDPVGRLAQFSDAAKHVLNAKLIDAVFLVINN